MYVLQCPTTHVLGTEGRKKEMGIMTPALGSPVSCFQITNVMLCGTLTGRLLFLQRKVLPDPLLSAVSSGAFSETNTLLCTARLLCSRKQS